MVEIILRRMIIKKFGMIQNIKHRQYFTVMAFIAMLTAVMTGCIKEEETGPGDDGETGTGSYLSLSFRFGGNTASARYAEDMRLKPKEWMVYNARLVFYSASTGKIVKVKDIDANNVEPDSPYEIREFDGADVSFGDKTGFISKAIEFSEEELKVNEYYMIMIVNPTEELKNRTNPGTEYTLSDLENEVIEYDETKMIGEDKNRFLMMSYFGKKRLSRRNNFYETTQEAEAKPEVHYIGRQVAAVLPYYTDNKIPVYIDECEYDLEAHNVVWNVNVVNRKMYWMRKPFDGENMNDKEDGYSKDPNFEKLSAATGGGEEDRNNNFKYLSKTDIDNGYELEQLNYDNNYNIDFTNANYVYIPENTMSADEQYGDVITSVVIALNLVDPQSEDTGAVGDDLPHWAYFDFGYSKSLSKANPELSEEFARYYEWLNNPAIWDKQNEELIDDPTSSGEDFTQLEEKFKVYAGAIEYMKEKYEYTGQSDFDCNTMESFSVKGFTFYRNGRMYYHLPIRHLQSSTAPGSFRRYGVVRNNAYFLHIYGVLSPGKISPEEPPLIPQGDALKVKVMNWDEIYNNFNFSGISSD